MNNSSLINNFEMNNERRMQIIKDHPIIVKNYTVITPVIIKTFQIVRERVWTRRTGAFLYARPRMGKTRCATVLNLLLKKEFPASHVVRFSADQRKGSTDTSLLADMLEAEGLIIKPRQTARELLTRLLVHIKTTAGLRGGKQYVLLIDEMQMLSEADFRLLLVLHNRLELFDILMTTIGFAQPEILETRTALLTTRSHNLIARFLDEPIAFDGCAAQLDLAMILDAYDEKICYPQESDWTFTRFFFQSHMTINLD